MAMLSLVSATSSTAMTKNGQMMSSRRLLRNSGTHPRDAFDYGMFTKQVKKQQEARYGNCSEQPPGIVCSLACANLELENTSQMMQPALGSKSSRAYSALSDAREIIQK
jgi:hypothetical protein